MKTQHWLLFRIISFLLAIGKEGQNARLAARLTGFKIDIKSETQARESGELYDYDEDEEYYEEEEAYSEESASAGGKFPQKTLMKM